MNIEITEQNNKGQATAIVDGKTVGMMSYSIPPSDFIIIEHTEVVPEFQGRDVGKALLNKIVAIAREKNLKILPLCPYANVMFKKLEELQDVLKK